VPGGLVRRGERLYGRGRPPASSSLQHAREARGAAGGWCLLQGAALSARAGVRVWVRRELILTESTRLELVRAAQVPLISPSILNCVAATDLRGEARVLAGKAAHCLDLPHEIVERAHLGSTPGIGYSFAIKPCSCSGICLPSSRQTLTNPTQPAQMLLNPHMRPAAPRPLAASPAPSAPPSPHTHPPLHPPTGPPPPRPPPTLAALRVRGSFLRARGSSSANPPARETWRPGRPLA
jgi:hypothetical protein